MDVVERPTFESEERRRIYQFVERHGETDTESVREALEVPDQAFHDHLERLTSKGYIEECDGDLALALDIGAEREYETEDLTFAIRPGGEADFEQLVAVIQAVVDRRTYAVAEELVQELRYQNTVTRHNDVWSRVFFVAEVDGSVVGWVHLDLPQVEKLRNTAQLTVGVREDYRGYGIGERLLDRALEWAAANDYRKVYNSLSETNMNAVTFLEAQGWEREAVREDHFTIDGRLADEVLMAYTL